MYHLKFICGVVVCNFLLTLNLFSQKAIFDLFDKVEMHTEDNVYSFDAEVYNKKKEANQFQFLYTQEAPIALFNFYTFRSDIDSLVLIESKDFEVITPFVKVDSGYTLKVRFTHLSQSDFLSFAIQGKIANDTNPAIYQLGFMPYTETEVVYKPLSKDLFIGEEKIYELTCSNVDNVKPISTWRKYQGLDYRVSKEFGQLRLHLIPNESGVQKFEFNLETIKPIMLNDKLTTQLPVIADVYNVKKGRLQFLNFDQRELTLDDNSRMQGVEIQIDNSPLIMLNKTYRIENTEEPGGVLIGELFTRSTLGNNKVLCQLRLYNYHRKSQGYLYIKDGDSPRFISNVDITPKTKINKISILHQGKNWTQNLSVFPDELLYVRIEGDGLHKANFHFEDVPYTSADSLVKREHVAEFKVTIPIDIVKKTISIFNNNELTGYELVVNEYQLPRDFDYIYVDYGEKKRLSGVRGSLVNFSTIQDVSFSFNDFNIDSYEKLYGKQYLKMDVIVKDKNNGLIEMKTIDRVVVCPSKKSPRSVYYSQGDCTGEDINLNQYLRNKTYELPEWSHIYVSVSNEPNKYQEMPVKKEIEIIQGRKYKFDIEVSFPAGLITVYKDYQKDASGNISLDASGKKIRQDEYTFGDLGGISMAMIAQYSFYYTDKIAKYKPYKIGAGFIALNAFNFNDNTKQDLGIVILGSLYPTTKDVKLTFPLFVGGGYLVKKATPFFLIGPGIRVRL